MKKLNEEKVAKRIKRTMRVRKKLHGTAQIPRLCVIKSNKHITAQLIDDDSRKTLAYLSTNSKEFRSTEYSKKSKKSAAKIGEKIGEFAKKNQIEAVVFDRGPFKYHGILAELANAARAAGLKF